MAAAGLGTVTPGRGSGHWHCDWHSLTLTTYPGPVTLMRARVHANLSEKPPGSPGESLT